MQEFEWCVRKNPVMTFPTENRTNNEQFNDRTEAR